MNHYIVEVYETHVASYSIMANSLAHAAALVVKGEGTLIDNEIEFIGVNDDIGMPVEQLPGIEEEMDRLHMSLDDHVPGIRSVNQSPLAA